MRELEYRATKSTEFDVPVTFNTHEPLWFELGKPFELGKAAKHKEDFSFTKSEAGRYLLDLKRHQQMTNKSEYEQHTSIERDSNSRWAIDAASALMVMSQRSHSVGSFVIFSSRDLRPGFS